MTADVVETATAARTYMVPAAVVAAATAALADRTSDGHRDRPLAEKLAAGKATVDDIIRMTDPTDTVGDALRGGRSGRLWADRITASVDREMDREDQQTRDRIGYDPTAYTYVGITTADNEDLITQLVRFPRGDDHLSRSEALTASGWCRAEFDFAGEDAYTYGVALDSSMVAFVASALTADDVTGVLLAYGEPITFLPEPPMLASAAEIDPTEDGDVYAVVDANDTTAVMDLIMIVPGPTVYRRSGGKWEPDQAMLESFMSATPPPIVELVGNTKEQLITQVDARASNQLVEHGNTLAVGSDKKSGAAPAGAHSPTKPETLVQPTPGNAGTEIPQMPGAPNPPEGRDKRTPEDAEEGPNSKPPVTASVDYRHTLATIAQDRHRELEQATARYYSDEGYASGHSLTAAIAAINHRAEARQHAVRAHTARSVTAQLHSARARITELENIIIPALTASTNKPHQHNKPGQRRAESLRKYWVHGEGALKIRWGTPGDFTRCVRQLREYLGARTEGYCALRHREAAGMWPGDRRNHATTE